MTKHEFCMPNGQLLTSVVMSPEEFDEACDLLVSIVSATPIFNIARAQKRMSVEDIETIRRARHLPLMARGTLTQKLFERYDITTDLVSFLVRGEGLNVISQMLSKDNGELGEINSPKEEIN